tara:strand:+ start:991 stop:1353 length:363 start_codon:yes stop_codon:yes gene_type:complete
MADELVLDEFIEAVVKPRARRMVVLEKKIEERVCKYATDKGFLVYKFTSPARTAVPDRMFVHPSGHIAFIEFKATGKKPTPQQEREHLRLSGHNVPVYVVDNVEEGKLLIDRIGYQCLGC